MPTTNIYCICRRLINVLWLTSIAYSPLSLGNTLHQIGITTLPACTRVTLDWDGASPFKHFMLTNPLRLVVDFEQLHLGDAYPTLKGTALQDKVVHHIRVSQFNPRTLRLVITLNTAVEARIFTLPPTSPQKKQQLVLDLYPVGKKQPIETVKPPVQTKITIPDYQNTIQHQPFVIMIDPGHGGKDPGATGPSKTQEKNVVLAIAKALKKLLSLNPRIKVYLTREEDVFIPLGVRVAKARERHTDLFISIHADASPTPNAHGSSIFSLSEKGSTSLTARLLAQSQNSVDQIAGISAYENNFYLRHTLLDLTQEATMHSSLRLGKLVLGKIGSINMLHHHDVEQANFHVLKAPGIPSILIETAFISNPDEEQQLINSDFQHKMAKAIMGGIEEYMSTLHK